MRILKNFTIPKKDYQKSTAYFILALIIGLVFIRGFSPIIDWDAANYISNGISLLEHGQAKGGYPGTLFSIVTVFLAKTIFHSTQFSRFLFLAIIPTSITIIMSYKISRIFVNRHYSLGILTFIFLLLDFSPGGISHMLIQAYSDGWLLMLLSVAGFLTLKYQRYYSAAVILAIAFFFRSQAIFLSLLFPILFEEKNAKNIFKFYLCLFSTMLILHLTIIARFQLNTHTTKDALFYSGFFNKDTLLNNLVFHLFSSIKYTLITFGNTFLNFAILLIIFFKCKTENSLPSLKRIFNFGLALFILQFVLVLSNAMNTFHSGENRYFIYSMLFLSLSCFVYLVLWGKDNSLFQKYFSYLVIATLIFRVLFLSYSFAHIHKRFYGFDFDETKVPAIAPNENIAIIGLVGQGWPDLVLKNQIWYTECYKKIEDVEKVIDQKHYKYIFFAEDAMPENEFKISSGSPSHTITFKKILESKKPYREFTLYKAED